VKDMMVDEDLAATLREEAERAELEEDTDEDVWVPRKAPRQPSMVYSIRIPVGRVEELRRVAAAAGLNPSAMVRQWVLERLDAEQWQGSEEEDLAGVMLATVSAMKKSGWSVIFTPDPDTFKPYMVKIPAGASGKSTSKRSAKAGAWAKAGRASSKAAASARAARSAKMPARVAAVKKVPAKAAPAKAVAAKKVPAKAAPAKAVAAKKVPTKAAPAKAVAAKKVPTRAAPAKKVGTPKTAAQERTKR